ncbi:TIGR03750 family conjugal transfer protein [Pasteurella oralis]|uniref:TIGR03750 family conjugal transfer protein n=1 Tax=Pasteurella oralis TaxID=1071947 RepID=UPI000C7D3333|nr:TIGR03750 family conjugal transfer protein [Pasteurella oralis]
MQKEHSSATITFLPERLNRFPTVYRGMTFYELMIVMIVGALIGSVVGLIVMLLFNLGWYSIFAAMVGMSILSVRFGGITISRLKRGKPDTWLERYIEYKKNPTRFITQQQYWSIKRTNNRKVFK